MAEVKVINKRTGKTEVIDLPEGMSLEEDTNPIKRDTFFKPDPTRESTIKAPTWEDKFFNLIGRHIRPSLTAVGGAIGGTFGSVLPGVGNLMGAAAGAGIGSGLGLQAETSFPKLFGEPRPSFLGNLTGAEPGGAIDRTLGVATDAAIDPLISKVGGAIGTAFVPAYRRRLLGELMSKHYAPDPEMIRIGQVGPTQLNPQLDLTVGQMNKRAGILEDFVTPREKEKIISEQRGKINEFFESRRPGTYATEPLVETAQSTAKGNIADWKTQSEQLYDEFEPFIDQNTKKVQFVDLVKSVGFHGGTVQPVTRTVDVKGAIPVIESKAFADDVGKQLDEVLGKNDINEGNIALGAGTPLKKLRDELNKIRGIRTRIDPATGQHMSDPIAEYRQLKKIKTSLNQFIKKNSGFKDTLPGELIGGMKGLAATINEDIAAGVKGWGPKAEAKYLKAQNYWKEFTEKVNPKMAHDLINAGGDWESTGMEVASSVMSDPQRTREAIRLTGDKPLFKKLFFNELVEHAWDPTTKSYNIDKALTYIGKDKKAIAREVMTDVEKKNTEDWLTQALGVKDVQKGGRSRLDSWLVKAGMFAVTGGITGAVTGGHIPLSTMAGVAGSLAEPTLMKNLVKRTLLDKDFRKIVSGAQQLSPISKGGQRAYAAIMAAIKTGQVAAMSEDERMPEPSGIPDEEKIQNLMRERGTQMLPYY